VKIQLGSKLICAAFLCLPLASCQKFRGNLAISGSITVSGNLINEVMHREESLFIVVKDAGGTPIAVKRIVNPQFPVFYKINSDDLLLPDAHLKYPLTVEAQLSAKGKIGPPAPGDFVGIHPNSVSPRQSRVGIVINRYL
jgi:hypothetical protein